MSEITENGNEPIETWRDYKVHSVSDAPRGYRHQLVPADQVSELQGEHFPLPLKDVLVVWPNQRRIGARVRIEVKEKS